jgi:DNA-binding CsgD family transcriptional regulator
MCQAWASTFSCPDAPMKALINSASRRVLRTKKSKLELIAQALEVIPKRPAAKVWPKLFSRPRLPDASFPHETAKFFASQRSFVQAEPDDSLLSCCNSFAEVCCLSEFVGRRAAEIVQIAQLCERYALLTPRERQVAVVASGLTNKQVANELSICEVTVKMHRGRQM